MRILALVNQKGGCGKTTSAINLSACLAFLQKKVLLIDLDPQGHATAGLGIKAEFLERTSYDLFAGTKVGIDDLMVAINDHFFVIPTHNVLAEVELEASSRQQDAFYCLDRHLKQMKTRYDFVVIDSPPNLGLLTYNALHAAEEVIIPIEPSFFSLHGLAKIFETIDRLNQTRRGPLRIHALMTRYEKRMRLSREIQDEVRKYFKDQTFHHVIHENVSLKETAAEGKSIVDYDRESLGFQDYVGLAIEAIERSLLWFEPESLTDLPKSGAGERNQEPKDKVFSSLEANNSKPAAASDPSGNEQFQPREVLGGMLFSYVSKEARSVMIVGDFNRWVAESMRLVDPQIGLWQKVVSMEAGTYHYKYLADNTWQVDPFNSRTLPNQYGGFDSMVQMAGSPRTQYENREKTKTRIV